MIRFKKLSRTAWLIEPGSPGGPGVCRSPGRRPGWSQARTLPGPTESDDVEAESRQQQRRGSRAFPALGSVREGVLVRGVDTAKDHDLVCWSSTNGPPGELIGPWTAVPGCPPGSEPVTPPRQTSGREAPRLLEDEVRAQPATADRRMCQPGGVSDRGPLLGRSSVRAVGLTIGTFSPTGRLGLVQL